MCALMYANGEGLPQDYQHSSTCLKMPLTMDWPKPNGDWATCTRVATVWRKTMKRPVSAISRLRTSIAKALANQGSLYEEGLGVPRNLVTSYMLFSLAEDTDIGDLVSIDDRARVAGLHFPKQIEEGDALASQWKPGLPLPS